jgi:hypothetical protein
MKYFFFIVVISLLNTIAYGDTSTGPGPVLLIRDYKGNNTIFKMPLDYGQTFTIRYIHSVDHAPVFEVFRLKKEEGLVLVETYFRMFGAGMGHWQGHGRIVQEGKWIKIKDINYPLGSFLLRVGSRGVDHTILLDGKEWNLSRIAAGRLVEVMHSQD